jgi:hypothetical protein
MINIIDPVYIICAILFIVILALEMRDRRHKPGNHNKSIENRENFIGGSWDEQSQSDINFGKSKNYGNFGTDGFYPPKMRCYDERLDFNCSNYVYNWSDKHMNVCKKQQNSTTPFLRDNTYIPKQVLARTNGRPRQCRRLI